MKALPISALFALVTLIGAHNAFAQVPQVKVDVQEIEVQVQNTPSFEAGNVKDKKIPNPKEWLEVEVKFECQTTSPDGLVPSLDLRYYIAIKGDGKTTMFQGDVRHVNIPAKEEMYSVVYLSPSSLIKATGKPRGFSTSDLYGVAVEVTYDGRVVTGMSEGGSGSWWKSASVSPVMEVLPKSETPFALLWLDRYADTQDDGRGR